MLKWTIANRKQSEGEAPCARRHSTNVIRTLQVNPIQKPKRRRSSNSRLSGGQRRRQHHRRSLNTNFENKENQFTSTPIKSPDECFHSEALRDVSNISPKDSKLPSKILTPKQKKQFSPKYVKHKRKKKCLDPTHGQKFSFGFPDYLETLENLDNLDSVGSCACKVYSEKSSTPKKATNEAYAPTLPTFAVEYSPCGLRINRNVLSLNNNQTNDVLSRMAPMMECGANFPPYKKAKIDHVNDFLNQISFITTPEDKRTNRNKIELAMSPLVQKLVGLRFTPGKNREGCNDSSYINNLSLNELVNAILDSSVDNSKKANHPNCNFMELRDRRECESFSDKNSTDSGFRSNTDSHNIDANFLCKCKTTQVPALSCDKTIINTDETFNERCVDDVTIARKRNSSENLDSNKTFTLKRQRCIRRRRLIDEVKTSSETNNDNYPSSNNSIYWESENNWNDNSFESSLYEQNDVTKDSNKAKFSECENYMSDEGESIRRTRRCLLFDSPTSDCSSVSSSKQAVTGSMELEIESNYGELVLKVLKCNDLSRSKVNAYIKVCLSDGRRKQQGTLQRTPVQAESCKPTFNHVFRLPLVKTDFQKRVLIEVWHRDRICRRSKFLGCMSFSVRNVIKKDIKGHFYLLPQSTGRCQNVPMTTDQISNLSGDSSRTFLQQTESCEENGGGGAGSKATTMCESQSSVEEAAMNPDDVDGDLKKSTTTNRTALSEQQKLADENLFLRYLELDPTEGPEAIPAALQRKATGNKNGRTPFTTTKKLNRQPKTGFGFSVVWTHPPRVERVEKGLPADRAGILPGDYIIFVDKHNVVMMPEIEILNLIRSYGNQLILEIFRRNTSRNGSVSNVPRLTSIGTGSSTALPAPSLSTQRRPSTVCSTTNTTSVEYNRRKLQLPQVTFSAEKPANTVDDAKKKAMYQLISKEQQYATGLQFAVTRFVSALAERKDLITAREHKLLFQNSEELLRISEDIVDTLMPEDGDPQFHLLGTTYQTKLGEITSAYRKYCAGIKKSDCILANKMKNSNSEFVRFLQFPAIPRRRPDITAFIHKPLEHFRDVLKLFSVILSSTKSNAEDYPVISQIVHDLQITYREITVEGGLMEPLGEGRPLLSVQDLENRLVFTKCKPFVLSKPGRQWIFGGDLSRIEGRNVRQYWALLFTDILLFAKVSRDRVLFIFEDPLSLAHITDLTFNVRKKVNEFRITVEPGGKTASSPTIHCGPDLTRTPRKNPNRRCIVLRAPTTELKAVWQNLLQRQILSPALLRGRLFWIGSTTCPGHELDPGGVERQIDPVSGQQRPQPHHQLRRKKPHGCPIKVWGTAVLEETPSPIKWICVVNRFHVNAGMDGSSFSSPLESPEAPITSSVATLQSAESLSIRRQNPQSVISSDRADAQKQIDELIEHKCKQLGKSNSGHKGGAIHLEQWMKGQLGTVSSEEPEATPEEENVFEVWTDEMLRKRSEELQVMINEKNAAAERENARCESRIEEIIISDIDCSPSRSTTSESQVTVRSSPVVPETLTVCKQCHRTCLTNQNGASIYASNNNSERTITTNNNRHKNVNDNKIMSNHADVVRKEDDWRPLVLMGLNAANPAVTLIKMDPFSTPVPRISIVPPTPDCVRKANDNSQENLNNSNCNCQKMTSDNGFVLNDNDNSPDSSPQTEDQPYHSLNSSNLTLRRFGTVSSLERFGSENREEEDCGDNSSESEDEDDLYEDEDEDDDDEDNQGFYNEAFNHSSLRTWTARAGSYVAQKMAIFEDYRAGSRFFERYLKTTEPQMNGEEAQEEETSGATSGEDVWGTPTSGGEMDDPLSSPNFDGRKSPNDDSLSSNDDNTELMMDELLMTPPVTSSNIRGLLPRRTLEPLMEEEYSDTYTSSSSSSSEGSQTDPSQSPEQGNETGNAADVCSTAAENPDRRTINFVKFGTPIQLIRQGRPAEVAPSGCDFRASCNSIVTPVPATLPKIHRSESYRHIIEAEDERPSSVPVTFFTRLKPTIKFVNIEKIPRSKGVKLLEFFNMKRERKIHESFGSGGRHLIKVYTKEEYFTDDATMSYAEKPLSPRRLKDKQLDRRFWKQLNKRRGHKPLQLSA